MPSTLCFAIASRNLVQFYYSGDHEPGPRLVEPHMLAYTAADNLALSAWLLGGTSESQEGQGWRTYLLEHVSNIVIRPEKFLRPRLGYERTGGDKFHNIQCAV
jgi:hypothetical protein